MFLGLRSSLLLLSGCISHKQAEPSSSDLISEDKKDSIAAVESHTDTNLDEGGASLLSWGMRKRSGGLAFCTHLVRVLLRTMCIRICGITLRHHMGLRVLRRAETLLRK